MWIRGHQGCPAVPSTLSEGRGATRISYGLEFAPSIRGALVQCHGSRYAPAGRKEEGRRAFPTGWSSRQAFGAPWCNAMVRGMRPLAGGPHRSSDSWLGGFGRREAEMAVIPDRPTATVGRRVAGIRASGWRLSACRAGEVVVPRFDYVDGGGGRTLVATSPEAPR